MIVFFNKDHFLIEKTRLSKLNTNPINAQIITEIVIALRGVANFVVKLGLDG